MNDTFGAAFSTVGGVSTDENGTVQLQVPGGLDNFHNTGTPIGNISDLIAGNEVVARISISAAPEPSIVDSRHLGSEFGSPPPVKLL